VENAIAMTGQIDKIALEVGRLIDLVRSVEGYATAAEGPAIPQG
jgi:hypothetical protein